MRLLTYNSRGQLCVTSNLADDNVEPYAILSHTWGKDEEEVTLHEIGTPRGRRKAGYRKIDFCGQEAQRDGWKYFWVDTCCIDKANSTELQTAITSMYRWYQKAQVCYVWLADVFHTQDKLTAATLRPWEADFRQSRWFTRGWTLQELLAPREVVFYSQEGHRLGSKSELRDLLHAITAIPTTALDGQPLFEFPVIERMRWTQGRKTKEKEDQAYCLLGIFGVYIYLNYGEGDNAFHRLQQEIDIQSSRSFTTQPHPVIFPQRDQGRWLGPRLAGAPLIDPDAFIGREGELRQLHEWLSPLQHTSNQQVVSIVGMGGLGKTQLSLAYARHYGPQYSSVFWLDAKNETSLRQGLSALAAELYPNSVAAVASVDEETIQVDKVRRWLSEAGNDQWLIIFDNYDDPSLPNTASPTGYDIRRFFPIRTHGRILITTRSSKLAFSKSLKLRKLDDINLCVNILSQRSGRDVIEDPDFRRLAARLDGLPLALALAGAYLAQTDASCTEYLDLYDTAWNDLHGPDSDELMEYEDRRLSSTWIISLDQVRRQDADAAELLRFFGYLNGDDIWHGLVQAGADSGPAWMSRVTTSKIRFDRAMSKLGDYSLVEVQGGSYRVHPCLHDWISEYLNTPLSKPLFVAAITCLKENVLDPLDPLYWTTSRRLLDHINRTQHQKFAILWEDSASNIDILDACRSFGNVYRSLCELDSAETMYRQALAGWEKAGPDHTSTLTTVNNLGNLYADQGKLDSAEQMYLRALAGKEKVLGPDHTSTLDTVNNLGNLYDNQGKLDEAEKMYLRALAGYEKALGPDHTSTLATVNNLGNLYDNQGKLDEAEKMYRRALAGYELASQASTIPALNTIYNLGLLCQHQGRLNAAEQWLQHAALGLEKIFGASHSYTIAANNVLCKLRFRIREE